MGRWSKGSYAIYIHPDDAEKVFTPHFIAKCFDVGINADVLKHMSKNPELVERVVNAYNALKRGNKRDAMRYLSKEDVNAIESEVNRLKVLAN